MAHFPIFIEIEQKKCLVIGGGKVALRKVEGLLRYGADVQVVGKEICGALRQLLPPDSLHEGELSEQQLDSAALVVVATGDRQANHRAAMLCRERGIPVNVADAPEEGTFLFPALVKKGDISIGINTGGKSPILSSQIRKEIEKVIPDSYAEIAVQMGKLRSYVQEHVPMEADRRSILKRAAAAAFEKEAPLGEEEIKTIVRQGSTS
ncbi:MAG: bifunctional precorrin-2 dehydrogenase/sirohydrochlorin ferrochelatase [Eubacteriales bacterium]|nr:bifunctional precorrin-2 dehydrogenase/sirohydrochlorin ferrochelatase [Eubacteriales bacterium]